VENTFISVPSEHFTSGPGSVCLADTALHASQPSTGSGRNSNSTVRGPDQHHPRPQQLIVTRFVASLRTDNCPQRKEARPLSHALTSD
jgi:hypothetical protein